MPPEEDPKKRGRKRTGASVLRPDGTTPEQYEILKQMSEDIGISIADIRRNMLADQMREAGFSDEDMGLQRKPDEDD
jgi:hypothetical protein